MAFAGYLPTSIRKAIKLILCISVLLIGSCLVKKNGKKNLNNKPHLFDVYITNDKIKCKDSIAHCNDLAIHYTLINNSNKIIERAHVLIIVNSKDTIWNYDDYLEAKDRLIRAKNVDCSYFKLGRNTISIMLFENNVMRDNGSIDFNLLSLSKSDTISPEIVHLNDLQLIMPFYYFYPLLGKDSLPTDVISFHPRFQATTAYIYNGIKAKFEIVSENADIVFKKDTLSKPIIPFNAPLPLSLKQSPHW